MPAVTLPLQSPAVPSPAGTVPSEGSGPDGVNAPLAVYCADDG